MQPLRLRITHDHATRPFDDWLHAIVVAVLVVLIAQGRADAQDPARARNLAGTVARNTVTLMWEAPLAPPQPIIGHRLDVGFSSGTTVASLPLGNVLGFSTVAPDGVFFLREIDRLYVRFCGRHADLS